MSLVCSYLCTAMKAAMPMKSSTFQVSSCELMLFLVFCIRHIAGQCARGGVYEFEYPVICKYEKDFS